MIRFDTETINCYPDLIFQMFNAKSCDPKSPC